MQEKHHDHYNPERNQHFKPVHHHCRKNQNELWQIDFRKQCPVVFDCPDTGSHRAVEEVPHCQANENIQGEKILPGMKDRSENKGINQHKAQRIQNPPYPVQIGTCYFRIQPRFRSTD